MADHDITTRDVCSVHGPAREGMIDRLLGVFESEVRIRDSCACEACFNDCDPDDIARLHPVSNAGEPRGVVSPPGACW